MSRPRKTIAKGRSQLHELYHKLKRRGLKLKGRKVAACKAANQTARKIVHAGTVNFKNVAAALGQWSFPPNLTRRNVTRKGLNYVFSDTFGLLRGPQGWSVTALTRDHPDFSRMLSGLLDEMAKTDGEVAAFAERGWTTATVNKGRLGQGAARHRDSRNVGQTLVVSVGRRVGGCLKVWPNDPGKVDVSTLSLDSCLTHDCRDRPVLFDGRQAHEVTSYEPLPGARSATRYSIVCYQMLGWSEAPPAVLSRARLAGIPVPSKTSRATKAAAEAKLAQQAGDEPRPMCKQCGGEMRKKGGARWQRKRCSRNWRAPQN
ncbi:unnamed protein product [Polarella glacialis]|uniref:Uncharacterized protein n=1 Tax=Polarella glacialis TaxID=89957 RepID=A0A813EMI5_POLGL|nr:unnamed protein product [Polarella glacialis]